MIKKIQVHDLGFILKLANEFRAAIDSCDRQDLSITLHEFPAGSCGDATLLLGRFLIEHGFTGFSCIHGERGSLQENTWCSHAWAQRGSLIVDITADQFPEIKQKAIVTMHSEWHNLFRIEQRSICDYRKYDERTVEILDHDYIKILKHLPDSCFPTI